MRNIALYLCLMPWAFQALAQPKDSTEQDVKYSWYNEEMNKIQFHSRATFDMFYKAWFGDRDRRVSIVHTGDSHIQGDVSTEVTRTTLQGLRGDGGQGMMFPYSLARTYSSFHYSTSHTGSWTYGKAMIIPPKVPYGITGMSGRTNNPHASFRFDFKQPVPKHYKVIRIYCKQSSESFDLELRTADDAYHVRVDQWSDGRPFIEVVVEEIGNAIEFRMHRQSVKETEFEIHGVELLSERPGGLVYHGVGVGGARFQGLLHAEYLEQHMAFLEPSMVILDFGTNDFLYDDSVKPELRQEIEDIIWNIRMVAPEACILLTTTQDLYYRSRNIRSGQRFAQMIREVAKDLDCAYWDWYWVSGGSRRLKEWRQTGLAQPDLVHLTVAGYQLKGKLLADAILATLDTLQANDDLDSLIIDPEPYIAAQQKRLQTLAREEALAPPPRPKGRKTTYRIRPGDTLGGIAQKHGVTVSQLRRWNNISGSRIYAGKVLVIYK